jgi:hypothetical protein
MSDKQWQNPIPYVPFVHNPTFDRVWLAIHAWESHKAGSSEAQKVEEEIQKLVSEAYDDGFNDGYY